jgi:hypothetical protein
LTAKGVIIKNKESVKRNICLRTYQGNEGEQKISAIIAPDYEGSEGKLLLLANNQKNWASYAYHADVI